MTRKEMNIPKIDPMIMERITSLNPAALNAEIGFINACKVN